MNLKFQFFHTGFCEAKEFHALSGGAFKNIKFYATFALLEHPKHGIILFDTGYTRRFFAETEVFPFQIYAHLTKVQVRPEEEAVAQLSRLGIAADEVNYIIISHFHADHIGGTKDFPKARFICSKAAYEDVRGKTGFAALSRGFVPLLLPDDFEQRVDFIDFNNCMLQDAYLGGLYDLFEDGSIQLCDLSGHAVGQMGALCETSTGPVFLIADAAWLRQNYENMHLPNQIVRLFFGSWPDFKKHLKAVHDYAKQHPETKVIPSHCEETMWELVSVRD